MGEHNKFPEMRSIQPAPSPIAFDEMVRISFFLCQALGDSFMLVFISGSVVFQMAKGD
jgi:hypothetical protein